MSRIRGQFRPEGTAKRTALWREAAEGIRLVWNHQLLRAVVVQAPLVNFAFTGVIFTITLALRQHGTAAGVIGLAQGGIAAGGLLGALAAPRLQGRLPLRGLVIVLTMAGTALFAVAALVLPSPLVAVPVAATLLLAPAANAAARASGSRSRTSRAGPTSWDCGTPSSTHTGSTSPCSPPRTISASRVPVRQATSTRTGSSSGQRRIRWSPAPPTRTR